MSLASFRVVYTVPRDVDITYCHKGDIDLHRHRGLNIVFFPLMTILAGRVRFPVDLLIISTIRFYGLLVSYVSRLNQLFRLQLNHHDINFMYSLCGNIRSDYYLKTRDMWVWLISCLPNSNRNCKGICQVSGNWLADELPYPFSPHDVGQYRSSFTC